MEYETPEPTYPAVVFHAERARLQLDRISRIILGAADIESLIQQVTQEILDIFHADRAWLLYPCAPETPSWRVPVEVTRPEYPGAFAEQAEIPTDSFAANAFRSALESDAPQTHIFEPSPENPDFQQHYRIRSQMTVALRPRVGKPWMLGIHQCSHRHHWSEEEKQLFGEIAQRITDSLSTLLLLRQLEAENAGRKRILEQMGYMMRHARCLLWHGRITVQADTLAWEIQPVDETAAQRYLPVEEIPPGQNYMWAWMRLRSPEDGALYDANILRALRTGNPDCSQEFRCRMRDGETHWFQEQVSIEPRGENVWYLTGVCTDITDSGMTEETMAHIFEPFYTTKAVGQGTGLGLATCYGIVKQAGGHIWVYSEPGLGTTFKVYLPLVSDTIVERAPDVSTQEVPKGMETILIVDDEALVRDVAARMLQNLGYTVLVTGSGDEALALANAYPEPIHLLVTDIVMPLMTGKQLTDRLSAIRPEIKVLYISGYTENTIVHHGEIEEGIAFLAKPFSNRALSQKVREVLDS